jgi:hypothetical protein
MNQTHALSFDQLFGRQFVLRGCHFLSNSSLSHGVRDQDVRQSEDERAQQRHQNEHCSPACCSSQTSPRQSRIIGIRSGNKRNVAKRGLVRRRRVTLKRGLVGREDSSSNVDP